jgi:Fe-S cluster assembly scaffold protein SufB
MSVQIAGQEVEGKILKTLIKNVGPGSWAKMSEEEKHRRFIRYQALQRMAPAKRKEVKALIQEAQWDAVPEEIRDTFPPHIRERRIKQRATAKIHKRRLQDEEMGFYGEFANCYRSPSEQKQDKLWGFWTQKLADSLNQQGGLPAI